MSDERTPVDGKAPVEEAAAAEDKDGFQFPTSLTVLAMVTIAVWISTFFVPAGRYLHDADGATVVGTYERIDSPRGFGERVNDLLMAPVNGLYGIINFQDPADVDEPLVDVADDRGYRVPDQGVIAPFGSGPLSGAVGVFLFVLAMGQAGAGDPRRDDHRSGDWSCASGGRRARRRLRHGPVWCPHAAAGIPRHLVDDGGAGCRDDASVDGDDADGGG